MAPDRSPTATVLRFVECINTHDVDRLATLFAPYCRFTDSLGATLQGRDALRAGWEAYFRMVPDYTIDVERVFADGADIVLLGSARGTYARDGRLDPTDAWVTSAAWLARVRDGQLQEWRVYADNEPIRARMRAPSA